MIREDGLLARLWRIAIWAVVVVFVLNVFAVIAVVLIDSVAIRWFGTWLPPGLATHWYSDAWSDFQLSDVLTATFEVVAAVVVISGVLGVTAAYALARRDFPGKQAVMLVFLAPLLVPPLTYGIPLATLLYKFGLGGTLGGVILANLVPTVPFMVLVMIPFIEQIDPRIEAAARVFGASTLSLFMRVLVPLLLPGVLAGLLLVMVRTIAMFELTFLTSGPTSQTLVVALYYAVFASGVRASQEVDVMAVVYMASTLIWLLIALRFVSPTQIVSRARQKA
jgi:putative spermidine/putrescine transport system permease protein